MVDYLEHGLEHADDRAIRVVLAFVEPAQPVEVTEELVRTVDNVDHVKAFAHVAGARPKGFASRGGLVRFRDIMIRAA